MNPRIVATALVFLGLTCAVYAGEPDPRWTVCGGLPQSAADFPAVTAHADAGASLTATDKAAIRREIHEHGWPSTTVLGRERVDALVHTIATQLGDQDFGEHMGYAMQTCAGVELDPLYLADLNDRFEMAHGRPQQFGTQYRLEDHHAVLVLPFDANISVMGRGIDAMESLGEQTARINARLAHGDTLEHAIALPSRPTIEPLTNRPLRLQLLAMGKRDQDREQEIIHATTQAQRNALISQVHAQTEQAKQLLDPGALPEAITVGIDAVGVVFLLIQHADDKAWFARQASRLHALMVHGSLRRDLYALYADRLSVYQGKPQLFGTQFHTVDGAGKPTSFPIADPAHLDERRASMLLGSFAEYAAGMQPQVK